MEYVNRVGREKGGVCIYVNDKVEFKTRKDLWVANATHRLQTQILNHVLLKLKCKMQKIF